MQKSIKLNGVVPITEIRTSKRSHKLFQFKSIYNSNITLTSRSGKSILPTLGKYLKSINKTKLNFYLDLNNITMKDIPLCEYCNKNHCTIKYDLLSPEVLHHCNTKECKFKYNFIKNNKKVVLNDFKDTDKIVGVIILDDGSKDGVFYYNEILFSMSIYKKQLSRLNKTVHDVILDINNITSKDLPICEYCKINSVKLSKSIVKPKILEYCTTCSRIHNLTTGNETKRTIIDEKSGKSLMKLQHEKRITTRKNSIDTDGTSSYEKWLKSLSRSKQFSKPYKNTELTTDSRYEVKWLNSLESVEYIKNGLIVPYLNTKVGKLKKYYSDFYIHNTNTIVEIKSTPIMIYRTGVQEVYDKFKSCLNIGYNILFVLDHKEIKFNNKEELDNFFEEVR